MRTDLFAELKRFGIFGASESGKSTLARKISLFMWRVEKRPTIVLDPISKSNAWGDHAKVFIDEERFWKYAGLNDDDLTRNATNCLVIVEDASVTINRDNALNGVFTTMRHRGHKLLVIGHNSNNLLPQMREQLQRVFLFLTTAKAIESWNNNFPGQDLTPATQLNQYEFLTVANYAKPERFKLSK